MQLMLGILRLRDDDKLAGFIEFGRYASGEIAMILRASNTPDSEAICKPTVSLEPYGAPKLGHGLCWIKTWSENAGVLEELERHGVVSRTGAVHFCGEGARAWAVRLSPDALAEFERQEKASR